MTPAQCESTLQGIQPITFQPHTPMSWRNLSGILSLGQLCLNHSSLQSQPQSTPKVTSMMAPQIGPHGLQENSISHVDWSASQHQSNQMSSHLHMQAHYPFCAACQFGKQRQRPSPGKRSSVVKDIKGN